MKFNMLGAIINALDSIKNFVYLISDSALIRDLKWIGGTAAVIFGVLLVLLVIKLKIVDNWFGAAGKFLLTHTFPKRHLNKSWQKILARLQKNDEDNLRLALIEADNLFDDLLKQMRLPGESMADRLKYIDSSQVSNIDEIWRAHKLRNVLVHNHEYPIARNEMEFGVKAYEKALKELEFID